MDKVMPRVLGLRAHFWKMVLFTAGEHGMMERELSANIHWERIEDKERISFTLEEQSEGDVIKSPLRPAMQMRASRGAGTPS